MEWVKTLINGIKLWVNNRISEAHPDYSENNADSEKYIENRPIYQNKKNKSLDWDLLYLGEIQGLYNYRYKLRDSDITMKSLGFSEKYKYIFSVNNGSPIEAYCGKIYSDTFRIASSPELLMNEDAYESGDIYVQVEDGSSLIVYYFSDTMLSKDPSIQLYWEEIETVLAPYWPDNSDISFITSEPTSNNTSDGIKLVVLDYVPEDQYKGYLYIVTEE